MPGIADQGFFLKRAIDRLQRKRLDSFVSAIVERASLIAGGHADRKIISRFVKQRSATATDEAGVDILQTAQRVIDETGIFVGIPNHTQRQAITQRNVDHAMQIIARPAAVDGSNPSLASNRKALRIRGVRLVFQQPAQRVGAIERALWPAQHFNAVHVKGINVGRNKRRQANRSVGGIGRLIDIGRNRTVDGA